MARYELKPGYVQYGSADYSPGEQAAAKVMAEQRWRNPARQKAEWMSLLPLARDVLNAAAFTRSEPSPQTKEPE